MCFPVVEKHRGPLFLIIGAYCLIIYKGFVVVPIQGRMVKKEIIVSGGR